jgi:hypothetical protein
MSNAVSAARIIGGSNGDRQAHDWYPSPPECTTSFLAVEGKYLKGMKILEPACGDGAISKILEDYGLDVVSTDLVYRGYGTGDVDFLWTTETECDAIITNPPFNLSEQFITHALDNLKVKYLALLVKSHYWHAKRRFPLFKRHPPAIIYPMTWRPDFLKKGNPTMDMIWSVWRPNNGLTHYQPIDKVV